MSRLSAGQHARHGRLITTSATRVQGVAMHCVNWGRHVQLTSSSSILINNLQSSESKTQMVIPELFQNIYVLS